VEAVKGSSGPAPHQCNLPALIRNERLLQLEGIDRGRNNYRKGAVGWGLFIIPSSHVKPSK